MYRDHAFELPPDHKWFTAGPEPPKRRTLEETLGFAQQVERAIKDGKSAAAVKAIISQSGVHFTSPFFKLWSGFTLEQIRPDLAHMIQVLGRHHVQAHCGKRDPSENKVAQPSKAGGGNKADAEPDKEADVGQDEAGPGDGEEAKHEEKEEKAEDGAARGVKVTKKRKSRAAGVVALGGCASEREGARRSRRTQRRKTNAEFVDLEEFDPDWSEDEAGAVAVHEELDFVGEIDEDDNNEPGGHVDYEVEEILNEKGGAGAGDHEYFVKWKHWPVPTWQPASSIKESVDHEVMKWESVRKEKGWPKIDEAAQRRELAKEERAEAKRRLARLRVKDSVTNAADKFIAEKFITPAGFSPRPSQLPCQRISSLKIWDWMRFVEVWGGLYLYHLQLEPEVSTAVLGYLDALRLLLKRRLGPLDRETMHMRVLEALVFMSRDVWPDTEQGCFLHLCLELARDAKRWLPRKPNMLSKERLWQRDRATSKNNTLHDYIMLQNVGFCLHYVTKCLSFCAQLHRDAESQGLAHGCQQQQKPAAAHSSRCGRRPQPPEQAINRHHCLVTMCGAYTVQ